MKTVLKYKLEVIIVVAIIFFYLILRLPNLTLQPIFADEAIYIRWAQIMRAEPTLRFLPLSDGKTPLFMWLMIPLFKLFEDPLFAGRFLSVISGFATLMGALFLGYKFFNIKVGLWSALLVTITPLVVFFDRMALVDSMLVAFSIWSLNFALLLVKYPRLDVATFLGYFLGGGLLVKTPALLNFLALPFSILVFNNSFKNSRQKLLKIFLLWGAAFVTAMVIYNILRLGPGFPNLSSRNQDYMFSPLELVGRPLDPFVPHFRDLVDWLPKLLTIPILLLMVLGIFLAAIKRNTYALVILLWCLLPLILQMALLKTFTARYILFSITPLLVLAAWVIFLLSQKIQFKSTIFAIFILVIILPFTLFFNLKLLTDPATAPLPTEERRGYLEDWTAGYGFDNIAQVLIEEAKDGSVIVGTEGSFGTLPEGLEIYLDKYFHTASKDQQIIIMKGKANISSQLLESAQEHPTFFVSNKSRFLGDNNSTLINAYPKAKGSNKPQDAILLFRVLPPASASSTTNSAAGI